MNRKKTVGLLAAVLGVSLMLTGCGEVKVNVEVGDSLPEEFQACGESGDVESIVSIENVDYTIEEKKYSDDKDIKVTISGTFTCVAEDTEEVVAVSTPKIEIQLLDEKGDPVSNSLLGAVKYGAGNGDSYESSSTFTVSKSGTYTVKLVEKSETEETSEK